MESNGCYGDCPQFSLRILQDGTARYDARAHNERQGQFSPTIKQQQMDSLLALVDSAHCFSLEDNYPARITDVVEYKPTLTLNDGTSKSITDQGPNGPAELKALYRFMLSLKTTKTGNKERTCLLLLPICCLVANYRIKTMVPRSVLDGSLCNW